jgi:hypothetical protein
MLPVAATLAVALLITALVDVVDGRAPLWGEALHIPEVLSVLFLWLLAVPAGRRAAPDQFTKLPARLRMVESPAADPGDAQEGRR